MPTTSSALQRADVETLAGCARGSLAPRDRAILWTLYDTGARLVEVLEMRPSDVRGRTVRIGRGDARRRLRMSADGAAAVREWTAVRPDGETLYVTARGRPLADAHVRGMLAMLADRAGWVRAPSARDFRRAYAMRRMGAGADVAQLTLELGNARTQVTRRFLATLERA